VSVSSGGGKPCALDWGGGLVGGDAVEVGAGELPVERCGDGVVATATSEGEDPFGEGVEIGQVVGVSTLRWRMEKFSATGCAGAQCVLSACSVRGRPWRRRGDRVRDTCSLTRCVRRPRRFEFQG
jgi:hypothetical protein